MPTRHSYRPELTAEALGGEPYMLTPPPPAEPRLNGAKIHGQRPGRPFLYAIAATGERPLTYAAEGLPAGLALDPASGLITGTTPSAGTSIVKVTVTNARGSATGELRLVSGDAIALTPPMGCNTWGGWGPDVTEQSCRDSAAAMVEKGLTQHGYSYINIDDAWQGERGGPHNAIQPNEKFGDLQAFCSDLHVMGLRAGIYSTPWVGSYCGFVGGGSDDPTGKWAPFAKRTDGWRHGMYRFAQADATQAAEWGFDYFKYDWSMDEVAYAREMSEALVQSGRDIVLELSNSCPWEFGAEFTALAQMTRTTGDLADIWLTAQLPDEGQRRWALGVRDLWVQHRRWRQFNRPGHWTMPCPLRVGKLGGWEEKPLRETRLTPHEQYSHLSLWCLWSAPLIIGCPIERLDAFTLNLLVNDEVLALDQDPLGQQADWTEVEGGEVLFKRLESGETAVGVFNLGEDLATLTVDLQAIGLTARYAARDLWRQADIGEVEGKLAVEVPPHGVVLLRLSEA